LDYNPLVIVVVPILGFLWGLQVWALVKFGRAYFASRRGS